jgi:hypothetical protein
MLFVIEKQMQLHQAVRSNNEERREVNDKDKVS